MEIYNYDFLGANELAEFDRIFTYHQLKQSQHSYIPNVIAQVQNSFEDSKNQKEQIKQDRESRATREQKKEVAERIERLRINEPGFLIDKGGKKYQGIVITKLADPSIFTGATVRVVTEERVKDFWIRSVQMLRVSSGDYYPIKIDNDSLLVRRSFLMKSIFHGQQASLFENPADESYVIKEKDEDIGYEVRNILISAKSANTFWDKYLTIKDKVNELKLDGMKKEDCRTLMNLMATCDK